MSTAPAHAIDTAESSLPLSALSAIQPTADDLQLEVRRWGRQEVALYRLYLLAMVATVAAVTVILFTVARSP